MFCTLDSRSDEPTELRQGDCVRSQRHGLGQVLAGGPMPLVRFLLGPAQEVPAEDLTAISDHDYATAIRNYMLVELSTKVRCYGWEELTLRPLPRWHRDVDGIWTDTVVLPEPGRRDVDHGHLVEDIEQDAHVLTAEEAKGRTNVINCTVTRVTGEWRQ